MTVALLSGEHRLALAAIALAAGVAAGLLAWRRGRPAPTIAAAAVAVLAALALAADRAVATVARSALATETGFNEHQLTRVSPWGPAALALGIAAAAAIIVLGVLASRRVSSPWRRAVLIGLRSGATLTALVLFVEPAIELKQVAREPNRVALVVDDSASMALRDDPGGPTRAERARAVLDRSEATLSAWRERREIDVYTFSDDLERASIDEAATGEPVGAATRVRRALESVRAAYEDEDLAGVVLISDGVATGDLGGDVTGEARQFLGAIDAPVHTVWAGSEGMKDVSIARVLADELAFVRTVVPVEAIVRSTGYGARRIPVTLSSEGEPLRRQWVDLEAGQTEARVRFEFTPPRTGKFAYEVSTPVADDEAVAENNARAFVTRIIRDKVRVLQVAGRPSWDVRALRSMLKANPNVDLISFFILRTQDDVSMVPNDELSLIPFPTHELFQDELPSFDVIVLQDFDFAPYRLGRYLSSIRRFVEGGGALVMLGGELSFASGDYRGTPVADALPVELPPRLGSGMPLLDEAPFSPSLTQAGAAHPITALRRDPAANRATWRALPELHGVNAVLGARDDATVLAVHPRLRTPEGDRMPVIVAGEHGEGRTLAVTTDSLWRWEFEAAGDPRVEPRFDDFWRNAIRWLIRDPELQYLRVSSGRTAYDPGSDAELVAELRDRGYEPVPGAEVTIEVERESHTGAREPLEAETATTGDDGRARRDLDDLAPGLYRVHARALADGETLEASDRFLVGSTPRELERPAADDDLLVAIARQTGGQYLGEAARIPPDLELRQPRIVRVDRRREVELWSRPALFILALVFLGLEWGLRQKLGSL